MVKARRTAEPDADSPEQDQQTHASPHQDDKQANRSRRQDIKPDGQTAADRSARAKPGTKGLRQTPKDSAHRLAAQLNYQEARTALELSLAELQASDLDVESMTGLYQRAEAYADRCEELLNQVEQEVLVWSAEDPTATPTPYTP